MNMHGPGRRLFDLCGSVAGLILLSPVLLTIACLILICEGRPVFFAQRRVGRKARLFTMWKFRSMAKGLDGPAVTAAGDQRVTRIGRHLRRFKLDELPQFFNVLKGDMSLIGPRPEVPEFVDLKDVLWQEILQVRPGITDFATLLYRNEEDLLHVAAEPDAFYRTVVLPAKLRLNAEYLSSQTFWNDLKLLALTIRYSFFPAGFSPERVARAMREPV